MKMIFGKEGADGLKEMQEYFSGIPGTLDFKDFKSDLIVAQDEVARYIGEDLLKKAIDYYHSPTGAEGSGSGGSGISEEDMLELVVRIQLVVTLLAYRDLAQNRDATHTGTGRVARMDNDSDKLNLKLIEQDDTALQRKGLKAMDMLINYVDEKGFQEWKESKAYKECREMLIWNADLFDRYYPIERNRRVFLMLVPMMRKVQLDHILPRLGEEQYAALLGKVKANDVKEAKDQLLYDLVCYPIAELALSEAFIKLPVQLFPETMVRSFWNAGNGAAALVLREKLVEDIRKQGQKSLENLESELERRRAENTQTEITDDTIVDIADRMDEGKLYARV